MIITPESEVVMLSKGSHKHVSIRCDYCSKVFEKPYYKYFTSKNITNKDCCKDCIKHKTQESNINKYGVISTLSINDVYNKTVTRKSFTEIQREFEKRDCTLLTKEHEYKNKRTKLTFICNNHFDAGEQTTNWNSYSISSHCCFHGGREESSRKQRSNFNREIYDLLRDNLDQWKKDSMESCDYKCVITGNRFDDIHHLYNFNKIVKETLITLGFNEDISLSLLTEKDISLIKGTSLELHYKYGLGVCLTKEIHKLFHLRYGNIDNNKSQFEEFKSLYDCRGDKYE